MLEGIRVWEYPGIDADTFTIGSLLLVRFLGRRSTRRNLSSKYHADFSVRPGCGHCKK